MNPPAPHRTAPHRTRIWIKTFEFLIDHDLCYVHSIRCFVAFNMSPTWWHLFKHTSIFQQVTTHLCLSANNIHSYSPSFWHYYLRILYIFCILSLSSNTSLSFHSLSPLFNCYFKMRQNDPYSSCTYLWWLSDRDRKSRSKFFFTFVNRHRWAHVAFELGKKNCV